MARQMNGTKELVGRRDLLVVVVFSEPPRLRELALSGCGGCCWGRGRCRRLPWLWRLLLGPLWHSRLWRSPMAHGPAHGTNRSHRPGLKRLRIDAHAPWGHAHAPLLPWPHCVKIKAHEGRDTRLLCNIERGDSRTSLCWHYARAKMARDTVCYIVWPFQRRSRPSARQTHH